ncbi:hypothetical protein E2C01_072233 [Portunus trituberculatus]|uniref:Uncharacterized protein n=1 Tax=Portunus trituberculatus TaxID=210409 RepID=A0A5B7I8D9_PORTR|nr:hypothetical protein [Portunus trituberculatus]
MNMETGLGTEVVKSARASFFLCVSLHILFHHQRDPSATQTLTFGIGLRVVCAPSHRSTMRPPLFNLSPPNINYHHSSRVEGGKAGSLGRLSQTHQAGSAGRPTRQAHHCHFFSPRHCSHVK